MTPLRKVKSIPASLNPKAIERAVASFVEQSHADNVDKNGYYNQIIENMAAVLLFRQPGRNVWIAEDAGEVIGFALTHVAKDVDNKLCYWMTDAWIDPKWRHTVAKEWHMLMEADAAASFCKHIIIPSSREPKSYCKFLGQGWHQYVVLLKKDI